MSRLYAATWTVGTIASGNLVFVLDEIGISAPLCRVHEFCISQKDQVGDAAEDLVLLQLRTQSTDTNGVSQMNEVPLDAGDGTVQTRGTYGGTPGSAGNILFAFYWNIRAPYRHVFRPGLRPIFQGASENLVLEAPNGATASLTASGYIMWEELGA